MAIEAGARVPPFEALRLELAQLRASPMVRLSGRAHIIDMVDAYLVATEARLAVLESHVSTPRGK